MSNEDWGTTTGLRGDDEDIVIVDAEFTFDSRYNSGATMCLRLVLGDENNNPSEDDILLPCGDRFDADKNGFLIGEDGGKRKPNINSAFGLWLNSAVKVAGEKITSRGSQNDPKVWVGTKWHTIREEKTFKVRGEERSTSRIVVTEYLGVVDLGGGSASGAKTVKAEPKAAPAADGGASGGTSGGGGDEAKVPGAVRAKLIQLVQEAGDYDSFMVAAYDAVPEVATNVAVEALVLDQSALYDKVKGA